VFGLVGHVHTDQTRPALVAVSGSFPTSNHMHYFAELFGGVSVIVVYLPGMVVTPWTEHTMAELVTGFEELLRLLLRDTPIILLGASTGNLLALGVTLPNIVRRIAVEPFFETGNLWPFIANSRARMAAFPEQASLPKYLWTHFGISENGVENRNYSHLLRNITQPTDVIFGEMRLMPVRELPEWPSFLEPAYREVLAANPLVTMHEGPPGSGHGHASFEGPGRQALNDLVYKRLREIWPRPGAEA
jgi:pimeloyl-ACP methyl ester carboxylesterase